MLLFLHNNGTIQVTDMKEWMGLENEIYYFLLINENSIRKAIDHPYRVSTPVIEVHATHPNAGMNDVGRKPT